METECLVPVLPFKKNSFQEVFSHAEKNLTWECVGEDDGFWQTLTQSYKVGLITPLCPGSYSGCSDENRSAKCTYK